MIDTTEIAVKTDVLGETMAGLMEELGDNLLPFVEGDTVEVSVLAVGGNRIWVDVAGQSLGFIPEKEITGSKSGLKMGDKIFCTVLSMENDDGNVVLSMKQADRDKYWLEMEQKHKTGEPINVRIVDANKGGLTTDIGGIQGFLPVSQLAPSNYPRVSGGDKDEILTRLRRFIGQEMAVKVINCDRENGKLIFSERAVKAGEIRARIEKYKVGDKIKGKITGIVDFGLFVSIDHQVEGLVHISEVSWSRVSDLSSLFRVGDEIEAMIIAIDDGRISLSLKRLLPDPWVAAAAKYNVGDVIQGEVTKITPFGAFVSLDGLIDGLVHVSELSDKHIVDPGQVVVLGKSYKFRIISIEPESHRLGLSLKAVSEAATKEEPESADEISDVAAETVEKKAKKKPAKTK
ncbi:MAG: S1 RNA-binding domain-containing protein [Patescibacteria group bacterium]